MKRTCIFVILALSAIACEIPFALDNVSEPAIYVEYLPSPDSTSNVMVAYAEPAFLKPSETKYDFDISDVTVLLNGNSIALKEQKEEGQETWNVHNLSLGDVKINPGDRVEVSVKGRGVKNVSASTIVPSRPVIESVTFESISRDSTDAWRVVIKLDREVKDGDYYGIKALKRNTWISASGPDKLNAVVDTSVYSSTVVPGRIASMSDLNSLDLDDYTYVNYNNGTITGSSAYGESLVLLTSKQFEGNSYFFYLEADDLLFDELSDALEGIGDDNGGNGEEGKDGVQTTQKPMAEDGDDDFDEYKDWYYELLGEKVEYRFEIFRLSTEFYNFAKAQYLANYNMLSNFGVTPPNFTYTNVSGGLGVVAGISGDRTDWFNPRAEKTGK